MSYQGPVLLTSEHSLQQFSCREPGLNEWLQKRALGNQATGASRTWVATDETGRVVAFYASATASVIRSTAPSKLRRNQPDDVPAVLLARLAVDLNHEGRGLGGALMKYFVMKAIEVSNSIGVALLLVHAKSEANKSFYQHYGFVESPINELTLMMVLPTQPK